MHPFIQLSPGLKLPFIYLFIYFTRYTLSANVCPRLKTVRLLREGCNVSERASMRACERECECHLLQYKSAKGQVIHSVNAISMERLGTQRWLLLESTHRGQTEAASSPTGGYHYKISLSAVQCKSNAFRNRFAAFQIQV